MTRTAKTQPMRDHDRKSCSWCQGNLHHKHERAAHPALIVCERCHLDESECACPHDGALDPWYGVDAWWPEDVDDDAQPDDWWWLS